ncbi:PRD domain-containing protein [Proteiniclasticum sp. BAD-10]|uniref:PRD domain-containing protein n=1 Tax=Proteiniclasticum sediminis TaxID=2804028 RepID=A0A941CQF3_9CLOT|nr:PRD domain-containing protein [Proteiniclasticum sediminis]
MKIIKVFNNNIIAALSDLGQELILTGSGLGFQKKPGDLVEEQRIEKVYEVMEEGKERFYRLLKDTPVELINATERIRQRAKDELGISMTLNALVGMIDHITYAVERKKNGIEIPNLMLHEIKSLYQEEFVLGMEGLDEIEKATGVRLSEHEAGYITMHIVNASLGENKESITRIFQFTNGVVNIIEEVFDLDFSEDEIAAARLNSHLKFLAKRILLKQPTTEDQVEEFYDLFMRKNKRFKTVIKKISAFMTENFSHELTQQEAVYLMVHINKAIS